MLKSIHHLKLSQISLSKLLWSEYNSFIFIHESKYHETGSAITKYMISLALS